MSQGENNQHCPRSEGRPRWTLWFIFIAFLQYFCPPKKSPIVFHFSNPPLQSTFWYPNVNNCQHLWLLSCLRINSMCLQCIRYSQWRYPRITSSQAPRCASSKAHMPSNWQDDKMTGRQDEKMTRWKDDKMKRWQDDKMTRWQDDKVTRWQVDNMTTWQDDYMTRWLDD